MENRSLVTIAEHSKEKIMYLLEMAREFEKKPNRRLLAEKVVATLFFEPSTRTRLSFETAANRLGARVIGFRHVQSQARSHRMFIPRFITKVSIPFVSNSSLLTFIYCLGLPVEPELLKRVGSLAMSHPSLNNS